MHLIKDSYTLFGIPFYKIVMKGDKVRHCLLGVPFLKKKGRNNKMRYYLFGVPVLKMKRKNKQAGNFVKNKVPFTKYTIPEQKELLIVNTDSIGDYILFRNFLREVKKSEKYKDYKITLLGCDKYQKFATLLDGDIVDTFLWIPTRPEQKSHEELTRLREQLHNVQGMKHYYDTIISPSYNSFFKKRSQDILLENVASLYNVFRLNQPMTNRNCCDFLKYTHVFMDYEAENKFDFDANKVFWENVLNTSISQQYPVIEVDKIKIFPANTDKEYVVINPCAYDIYRMWHINNWCAIIRHLKNDLGYDVVIACGPGEKEYCDQVAKQSGVDVDVQSGLPIERLLSLLKLAKLYIGQDSGIFHVAAALDIRALCLSAGNAYFRFMNYPKSRKNIKVLFPAGTEEWILKSNKAFPALVRDVNSFYINQIRPIDVVKEIGALLSMNDVFFVHKCKTQNTNDKKICVYDYFSEYFSNMVSQRFDIDDLSLLSFKKAVFIIGGGGLVNQNNDWNAWMNDLIEKGRTVIGWGIGFNQHFGSKIKVAPKLDKFSLLGMRDYNKDVPYLPCVSCLSTVFEEKYPIKRRIGCIVHYENVHIPVDGLDVVYNNQPFEEIITFIAETEVVVTNTYHVMYWSTLMNKKVILLNPFSDRFMNFKYKPVIYSGNLEADIKKCKQYPEALAECRALNRTFFNKVKKLIEKKESVVV